MAKETSKSIFKRGKQMIEKAIQNGTTPEDLENHHYGGMLILSSVAIGRTYGGIDDSKVEQARLLLSRSYDALRKYCNPIKRDIASMFSGYQKERLEKLASFS